MSKNFGEVLLLVFLERNEFLIFLNRMAEKIGFWDFKTTEAVSPIAPMVIRTTLAPSL